MDSIPYLIQANLSDPIWVGGKGKEIGTVYGKLEEVAQLLSRPFFYYDGGVMTYALSRSIWQIVIGLENYHVNQLGDALNPKSPIHCTATFFGIYVDCLVPHEKARQAVTNLLPNPAVVDFDPLAQ